MKLLFVLTVFIVVAEGALAQWVPEIRLTNDPAVSQPGASSQRSITADGYLVHVVWQDNRDGHPEIYYKRSVDGGITWGLDMRLTKQSASVSPSIAVSGSVVHIVWTDERDGNSEIYYTRSTDGGENWEADKRLTTDTSGFSMPSIDASGSILHVVWEDDRSGNYEIYYKRSTDAGSTWEADVRLTNNAAASYFPTVAVSGSTVHAAWSDYRDAGNEEIYYKRSSDGGSTWSPDIRLTQAVGWSEWPGIAASGSLVHLVWYDFREGGTSTGQIYYKRSTDGGLTWESDVRITADMFGAYVPSVAASDSVVHLVWSELCDIYSQFSSDAGASWAPAIHLTNNQTTVCPPITSNPCVALSGPTVHVIWEDNRNGNGEIYYRRNPTGTTVTGLQELHSAFPKDVLLISNYPNPLKETTHITYRIEKACFVDISVRDIMGSKVATLVHEVKSPGEYAAVFDGGYLVSGLYFLTLQAGGSIEHSTLCISR